ncbi:LOW QUALITY PROTEIN: stAR-related lipid transfer protein 13-like [Takifugu rubripes]|uniref:LOW QUALITY PROTEIN: stAR-related lipid transfer protein 13-like n=1 Tax=Takifugu rubripes TaxID=31033 RepID=UPI0011460247|nr:LOW QUALITY PROTEIN: stAR-related lipid transfer protein 13-like [Takifugu rubripes]
MGRGKDSQFPVDISSVKRDHDFLERDLVEPLCRRLNTLNKCASMKVDVSHPKRKQGDDSDEDDPLAISKRWTFEWSSRRWSRLQDFLSDSTNESSPTGQGEGLPSTVSSESVLTDLSEQELAEVSSLHSEDSTSAMPDSISMASLSASYQPPRELPHYNSLPIKINSSYENLLVHIPQDHKPGTFPKALSIESLAPSSNDKTGHPQNLPHSGLGDIWPGKPLSTPPCPGAPRGSRVSVYDNVPGSHLYASTGDLLELEDGNLFPHLDDIIQHVSGLQQIVDHWSRSVLHESGTEEGESRTTPSEGERDGVSLNDTDSTETSRERRDSGVGASLTRPRLRWPSFRTADHLNQPASSLQISSQSAGQLSLLQKFSLLRLTAIMEKYSMSNKHGWTWSVPKFMKRMKVPDYKEKSVFGVPLIIHVQRCGFPLPLCLQQALSHLRTHCLDQVGLFRKSGVKSRIQALRQQCELTPDCVNYEDQSAYDVADMVKQFFQRLPEPLLTSKLGETFLHIYQYVPTEQRLQAVRAAILLMPDENREVLQTLLYFLRDVTSLVEENQMTPMNLAVCLGPSLFHLSILKNETLSPRSIQRKYTTGRPDQKDLTENLAATEGLAHLITECQHLFQIPEEMVTQSRNSYLEAELMVPPLDELGKATEDEADEDVEEHEEGSYYSYLERLVQNLQEEAKDKSKGWVPLPTPDHTELAYRRLGVVLESQYLLEPCGTARTRLTHVSRVDLRGRSPEWYNKAFGHLCANEAQTIRSSFHLLNQTSIETKT